MEQGTRYKVQGTGARKKKGTRKIQGTRHKEQVKASSKDQNLRYKEQEKEFKTEGTRIKR
jgi:hypothetical protein